MNTPFLGSIFGFSANFAPYGWATCSGQVVAIAVNDALYALLGTVFGGDGVNTFNLPDLRGRIPVGQGQGLGLSNYVIGQSGGNETITVSSSQMPQHTHAVGVNSAQGNLPVPTSAGYVAGTYSGSGTSATAINFYSTASSGAQLAPNTISQAGSSLPIEILQPILAMQYIICTSGIFPSRN